MQELERFVVAQNPLYQTVLGELKAGRKQTHWMWFIFPQLAALGSSPTAKFFGIKDWEEAVAYISHPVLKLRLLECSEIILSHNGLSALEIFGAIDSRKLQSSMTLFCKADPSLSVFNAVLAKYFDSETDAKTVSLLGTNASGT